MKTHIDLDHFAEIRPEERDYYLKLRSKMWGRDLERWEEVDKPYLHFSRTIPVHEESRAARREDSGLTWLEELIIPFPSAPIYGINRKAEYSKTLEHRPNMHSVRLLRRPNTAPIHRLFILHNGLNEADSLKFYYRLADWIMRQQEEISRDEGVACLIMPFPGHLMHSSFHGPFSETPLSRYLNDAGDLFRQFLRYMVGIRWLLSIIADSDAKDWMVGGDLLDPESRVDDLLEESKALYDMSTQRIARTELIRAGKNECPSLPPIFDVGEETSKEQVLATDALLRTALDRDSDQTPPSLRVHVVGYSLGGFVAQSVFFAWPQVISSCTTICSGGAISALSPTAFAQPEEWQSVLHALRPETTNSMLQGRLGDDEQGNREVPIPLDKVAGMPLSQYGYFHRIFEQVFLQEDRGSYKERLSEYGLRMLFVSGGEDPIVPPGNILDASPREGTTMLSVAGMTHFLNQDPKDDGDRRETEQRDFWLPEAGGMIARAAIHAEKVHMDERTEAAGLKRRRTRPASKVQTLGPQSSDLLSNGYMFEAALDWVLDAVNDDAGWLVICRNVLPAAFIPTQDFTKWGTGLHHHDLRIQRYTLGLRHRAGMLRKIKDRTTLIVPDQLGRWFVDLSARFEPHSDGPAGRVTTKQERRRIWREFEKNWWPSVRQFKAGNIGSSTAAEPFDVEGFTSKVSSWLEAEPRYLEATHLPDAWIGIRADSELIPAQSPSRKNIHVAVVEGIESVLADLVKFRDAPPGKASVVTKARKRLENDLSEDRIRMLQVSGAEFNPRYRGKIERSTTGATRLLASAAAGLMRSRHMLDPLAEQTTAGPDAPPDPAP
jgi:pimeloyl-ACP methyl ester carboxylesterase